MAEALEAPHTQGGGGTRSKKPSPLKDPLCAKFHPDPSISLDFYREQTLIALYILDFMSFVIQNLFKTNKCIYTEDTIFD